MWRLVAGAGMQNSPAPIFRVAVENQEGFQSVSKNLEGNFFDGTEDFLESGDSKCKGLGFWKQAAIVAASSSEWVSDDS